MITACEKCLSIATVKGVHLKGKVEKEVEEARGVVDAFLGLPGLHYKWSGAKVFVELLWFFSQ